MRMQKWNGSRVYPELSEGKPGLVGAMISRGEAQVMRIACMYALMDKSQTVGIKHLEAALSLWEFSELSRESRYLVMPRATPTWTK